MTDSEKIFKKLKASRKLPSLPQVVLKLIQACNDEDASIGQVSDILSKDPSLSAKVLQLVNSSYMGLTEKVTCIEDAAVYLGLDNIITFAMSASVLSAFGAMSKKSSFDLNRFWWHSIQCALLAREIAAATSYTAPDEAFLAGFLHDIGRLILGVNFEKEWQEIEKEMTGSGDPCLLENMTFGVTHADVGYWLVNQWQMKSFLADAVKYHHEPVDRIADAFPLVKIIYVANALCQENRGQGDTQAKLIFEFDASKTESLVSKAREEAFEIAKSFGIQPETEADPGIVEEEGAPPFHEQELLKEIKNVSLLYGTLQNLLKADGRNAIIKIVEGGLRILLGAKRVFFFFPDPDNDLLIGYAPQGSPYDKAINGLVIPLSNKGSRVVRSFDTLSIADSFGVLADEPGNIVDDQIVGLLSTQGMLCLPMRAFQTKVGTIVVGMDEGRASHLPDHLKMLKLFAGHSAMCFHMDSVKQNKAMWLHSERMEASSLIARKVVHEVNNPLGIIKNYLNILGLKLPEDHPAKDDLGIINEEIERIARILDQLSDFSELSAGKKEPFDINAFISDLVNIIKESILSAFQIRIYLDLDPTLPRVVTEKDGLKQVFINLIKNATEAMQKGGNIYITTRQVHASDKIMGEDSGVPQELEIIFRDDGPGMADDIRQHIFEPYNTSKGRGHSGLGLTVVHNIINNLKGSVTCLENMKTGTAFRITLPLVVL